LNSAEYRFRFPVIGSVLPDGRTKLIRLSRKWGPAQVAKDPAAFVRETREVVAALKHRIGREDRELYDLIDRAGLASAA
jgi:hypothetical protein